MIYKITNIFEDFQNREGGTACMFLSVKNPGEIRQTPHHTRLKALVPNYLSENTLEWCYTPITPLKLRP